MPEPMEQPTAVGDLKGTAAPLSEKSSPTSAAPGHHHHDSDTEILEDFPSMEEQETLRRVSAPLHFKVFTIAFIELCERFSYYGSVVVFTNFIQQDLPPGSSTGAPLNPEDDNAQPGALGMGQRASTGITTFNQFYQYLMPLFGAYIADQYWGRYKTVTIALFIDILGHIILIASALPGVINKPGNSLAAMIIAILTIGFGTGGFKPNISPMIVEQLPIEHMKVTTLKSGERVIIDPASTINKVYLWFYFFINVGALVGQIGMVYAERYVGFYLSYTLPTCMLLLCPAVMLWGKKRYKTRPASGSVLGPALKTFFLAQKGRWSINPFKTWKLMHDGTFWENVKPSKYTNETRPKWMTFDDAWVDELRRGFNACAVFCWYPIYWLTYNQLNNNLVSQAAVLEKHGVPNDVLSNLNPFSLLIFIPLMDFVVYPTLRKWGIRFTPIKRITLGFYIGAAAMVWACVIQAYIYKLSECGYYAAGERENPETGEMEQCPVVPINVWAQTGSYVLIALSEVFASITSLEYAFSKAPKNMRSMVQAVALFATAFSAAIGQGFTALSADPLLVWNYGTVGVLAALAGTIFWFQFKSIDAEEDALNELPEGHVIHKLDPEETPNKPDGHEWDHGHALVHGGGG